MSSLPAPVAPPPSDDTVYRGIAFINFLKHFADYWSGRSQDDIGLRVNPGTLMRDIVQIAFGRSAYAFVIQNFVSGYMLSNPVSTVATERFYNNYILQNAFNGVVTKDVGVFKLDMEKFLNLTLLQGRKVIRDISLSIPHVAMDAAVLMGTTVVASTFVGSQLDIPYTSISFIWESVNAAAQYHILRLLGHYLRVPTPRNATVHLEPFGQVVASHTAVSTLRAPVVATVDNTHERIATAFTYIRQVRKELLDKIEDVKFNKEAITTAQVVALENRVESIESAVAGLRYSRKRQKLTAGQTLNIFVNTKQPKTYDSEVVSIMQSLPVVVDGSREKVEEEDEHALLQVTETTNRVIYNSNHALFNNGHYRSRFGHENYHTKRTSVTVGSTLLLINGINLNNVVQGNTNSDRQGNEIVMNYLHVRFYTRCTANNIVRLVVGVDRRPNGAMIPRTDVIDTSTAIAEVLAPLNDQKARTIILHDSIQKIQLAGDTEDFSVLDAIIPMHRLSAWFDGNAGTIADCVTNAVFVGIGVQTIAPTVETHLVSRLYFEP